MEMVYIAHPYGGDPANLVAAKRWMRWLLKGAPGVAWVAPWITDCEVLDESTDREAALRRDLAVVSRCSAIVLLGPVVSAGMAREAAWGNKIYELTGCLTMDDAGNVWRTDRLVDARIDPRDITWRIEDGRSRGFDYARVERVYAEVSRLASRPTWACTPEEVARWNR